MREKREILASWVVAPGHFKSAFFFFFNLSIDNGLKIVIFELATKENLDIDVGCLMKTSMR